LQKLSVLTAVELKREALRACPTADRMAIVPLIAREVIAAGGQCFGLQSETRNRKQTTDNWNLAFGGVEY